MTDFAAPRFRILMNSTKHCSCLTSTYIVATWWTLSK